MKLTGPAAAAARQMLADPLFEVIPLSNLDEQVGHLPHVAGVDAPTKRPADAARR